MFRFDDSAMAQAATPEDAVRMGADAFAIVCFVRGPTEWRYMQTVAEAVRAAARFEMPGDLPHLSAKLRGRQGGGLLYP